MSGSVINSGSSVTFGTWASTRQYLGLGLLAAAMFAAASSASSRAGLTVRQSELLFVAARAATVVSGFIAYCLLAGAAVSFLVASLRSLWFGKGWLFNEDKGEWEQVDGRDRFGYLTDARDHLQRRSAALQARKERGEKARTGLVMGGIAALILWEFRNGAPNIHHYAGNGPFSWTVEFFAGGFLVIGGLQSFFLLLGSGIAEAAYQLNFQRMRGPKVRDPMPVEIGGPDHDDDDPYNTGGPARPHDIGDAYGDDRPKRPPRRFRD